MVATFSKKTNLFICFYIYYLISKVIGDIIITLFVNVLYTRIFTINVIITFLLAIYPHAIMSQTVPINALVTPSLDMLQRVAMAQYTSMYCICYLFSKDNIAKQHIYLYRDKYSYVILLCIISL